MGKKMKRILCICISLVVVATCFGCGKDEMPVLETPSDASEVMMEFANTSSASCEDMAEFGSLRLYAFTVAFYDENNQLVQ